MNTPHYRILAINPGSTSTKVAVYDDETPLCVSNIRHSVEELSQFADVNDQHSFRKQLIEQWLHTNGLPLSFDAIIGRGGLIKPIAGGVYGVNEALLSDTRNAHRKHACNLGCLLAYELAQEQEQVCLAFIADPVMVDEMLPEAHVSGSPLMPRHAIWHALNQRAIARRYAKSVGKRYEDLNLIICHLGGGISVAAHQGGRAIDVNNALDGDGPFTPERSGSLPATDLIRLCFSGQHTEAELIARITGRSGLMAHLGTTDIPHILQLIEQGDEHARLLIEAMTYHTAKQIAAESAVLCGHIDAILLTGGIAHSDYITERIARRVKHLAPVHTFPGEDEMEALALNALGVLRGEMQAKVYV